MLYGVIYDCEPNFLIGDINYLLTPFFKGRNNSSKFHENPNSFSLTPVVSIEFHRNETSFIIRNSQLLSGNKLFISLYNTLLNSKCFLKLGTVKSIQILAVFPYKVVNGNIKYSIHPYTPYLSVSNNLSSLSFATKAMEANINSLECEDCISTSIKSEGIIVRVQEYECFTKTLFKNNLKPRLVSPINRTYHTQFYFKPPIYYSLFYLCYHTSMIKIINFLALYSFIYGGFDKQSPKITAPVAFPQIEAPEPTVSNYPKEDELTTPILRINKTSKGLFIHLANPNSLSYKDLSIQLYKTLSMSKDFVEFGDHKMVNVSIAFTGFMKGKKLQHYNIGIYILLYLLQLKQPRINTG